MKKFIKLVFSLIIFSIVFSACSGGGNEDVGSPQFITGALEPGQVDESYNMLLEATGGSGDLDISLYNINDLPSGLEFDPSSSTLFGIPVIGTTVELLFKVTDERGETGETRLVLRINQGPEVTLAPFAYLLDEEGNKVPVGSVDSRCTEENSDTCTFVTDSTTNIDHSVLDLYVEFQETDAEDNVIVEWEQISPSQCRGTVTTNEGQILLQPFYPLTPATNLQDEEGQTISNQYFSHAVWHAPNLDEDSGCAQTDIPVTLRVRMSDDKGGFTEADINLTVNYVAEFNSPATVTSFEWEDEKGTPRNSEIIEPGQSSGGSFNAEDVSDDGSGTSNDNNYVWLAAEFQNGNISESENISLIGWSVNLIGENLPFEGEVEIDEPTNGKVGDTNDPSSGLLCTNEPGQQPVFCGRFRPLVSRDVEGASDQYEISVTAQDIYGGVGSTTWLITVSDSGTSSGGGGGGPAFKNSIPVITGSNPQAQISMEVSETTGANRQVSVTADDNDSDIIRYWWSLDINNSNATPNGCVTDNSLANLWGHDNWSWDPNAGFNSLVQDVNSNDAILSNSVVRNPDLNVQNSILRTLDTVNSSPAISSVGFTFTPGQCAGAVAGTTCVRIDNIQAFGGVQNGVSIPVRISDDAGTEYMDTFITSVSADPDPLNAPAGNLEIAETLEDDYSIMNNARVSIRCALPISVSVADQIAIQGFLDNGNGLSHNSIIDTDVSQDFSRVCGSDDVLGNPLCDWGHFVIVFPDPSETCSPYAEQNWSTDGCYQRAQVTSVDQSTGTLNLDRFLTLDTNDQYQILGCDLGGIFTPSDSGDDCDKSDESIVTVTFSSPNVNNPPQITSGPSISDDPIFEFSTLDASKTTVSVSVEDSDGPGSCALSWTDPCGTMKYYWTDWKGSNNNANTRAYLVQNGTFGSNTVVVQGSCNRHEQYRPVRVSDSSNPLGHETTIESCIESGNFGNQNATVTLATNLDNNYLTSNLAILEHMQWGSYGPSASIESNNGIWAKTGVSGIVWTAPSADLNGVDIWTGETNFRIRVVAVDGTCRYPGILDFPEAQLCDSASASVGVINNVEPSAGLTFEILDENPTNLRVSFDASSSFDLDSGPDALKYMWDFDSDGTNDLTTLNSIYIHTYTENAPFYDATLTVTDGISNDSETVRIQVNQAPEVPKIWIYGVDEDPSNCINTGCEQGQFSNALESFTTMNPISTNPTEFVNPSTGKFIGLGVGICDDDNIQTLEWDLDYDGVSFFADVIQNSFSNIDSSALSVNDTVICDASGEQNFYQWELNSTDGINGLGSQMNFASDYRVAVRVVDEEGATSNLMCLNVYGDVNGAWDAKLCREGDPQSNLEIPLTVGNDEMISGDINENDEYPFLPAEGVDNSHSQGQHNIRFVQTGPDTGILHSIWISSSLDECLGGETQIRYRRGAYDGSDPNNRDINWEEAQNISHEEPSNGIKCGSNAESPNLTVDPGNSDHLIVFFGDDENGDLDVYWIESIDAGSTWSQRNSMPGLGNSDLRASGQGAQTQPVLSIEPTTGSPFDDFWHLSFVEASSGRAKMFHMMSDDQGASWVDGNKYDQRINNAPQVHVRVAAGFDVSVGMATNESGPDLECWVSDYEDDGGFLAPVNQTCEWNANYDTNIQRAGGGFNPSFIENDSCENDSGWGNSASVLSGYSYATTGLKRVGARFTDSHGAVGCGVIWVPVNNNQDRPPVPVMRLRNPSNNNRAIGELDETGNLSVEAQCAWRVGGFGDNNRGSYDPDETSFTCEFVSDWDPATAWTSQNVQTVNCNPNNNPNSGSNCAIDLSYSDWQGFASGDARTRVGLRACSGGPNPGECSPIIWSHLYVDDYENNAPVVLLKIEEDQNEACSLASAGVLNHDLATPSFNVCFDATASFDREDEFVNFSNGSLICDSNSIATSAPIVTDNGDGTGKCTFREVGDYAVKYELTDNNGEVGERTVLISVGYGDDPSSDGYQHDINAGNSDPQAVAIVKPFAESVRNVSEYDNTGNASVYLDGRRSVDADGEVVSWDWDLNYDGITFNVDVSGNELNSSVDLTFGNNVAGANYREGVIALRATDNLGATNIHAVTYRVMPNENEAPQGAISASPFLAGFAPLTVDFNAVAVDTDDATWTDPTDCDGCTYEWDFDVVGGTFTVDATGETENVTFSEEKDYTVGLRITDADGSLSPVITTVIHVGDCPDDGTPCDSVTRNRQPQSYFFISGASGALGTFNPGGSYFVDFDGSRSDDLDGNINEYQPVCNGGTISQWTGVSDSTWRCSYDEAIDGVGIKTVSLTVTDDGGLRDDSGNASTILPADSVLTHTVNLDVYVSDMNQDPMGSIKVTGVYYNHDSLQPVPWNTALSKDADTSMSAGSGIASREIDCNWAWNLPFDNPGLTQESGSCSVAIDGMVNGANLLTVKVSDDEASPSEDVRTVVVWVDELGSGQQRPVALADYTGSLTVGSSSTTHNVEIDLNNSWDPDGDLLSHRINCGAGGGIIDFAVGTCNFPNPAPGAGPVLETVEYSVCDNGTVGGCGFSVEPLIRDHIDLTDFVIVADGVCATGLFADGIGVRVSNQLNPPDSDDRTVEAGGCDPTDPITDIVSNAQINSTTVDIPDGECIAQSFRVGNPIRIEDDNMFGAGPTNTTITNCTPGSPDVLEFADPLLETVQDGDNARVVSLLDTVRVDGGFFGGVMSPAYLVDDGAQIEEIREGNIGSAATAGDNQLQLAAGSCADPELNLIRGRQGLVRENETLTSVFTIDTCGVVGADVITFPEPLRDDYTTNGIIDMNDNLDIEYLTFEIWNNRPPVVVAHEENTDWVVPVGGTTSWHSRSQDEGDPLYLSWDPDGDSLQYAWECDSVGAGNTSAQDCQFDTVGRPAVSLVVSDGDLSGQDNHNIARATNTTPMPIVYIDPQTDFLPVVDSLMTSNNVVLVGGSTMDLEGQLSNPPWSTTFQWDCGDGNGLNTSPPFSPGPFNYDLCSYPASNTPTIPHSVSPIELIVNDPHVSPGCTSYFCLPGSTSLGVIPVRNMLNRAPRAAISGPENWDSNTNPNNPWEEDHLNWVGTFDVSVSSAPNFNGTFSVPLSAHNSIDPDDQALTYSWDCGNGSPVVNTPVHTCVYQDDAVASDVRDGLTDLGNDGTGDMWTVTLTVTDSMGVSDTDTASVRVVEQLSPQSGIFQSDANGQNNYWVADSDPGIADLKRPDLELLDVFADGTYLFPKPLTPFGGENPGGCPFEELPNCDSANTLFDSVVHLDASRSLDPYGRNIFVQIDCDWVDSNDFATFSPDMSGSTFDALAPAWFEHVCRDQVSGPALWNGTDSPNSGDSSTYTVSRNVSVRVCETASTTACAASAREDISSFDMTLWRNRVPLAHITIQDDVFSGDNSRNVDYTARSSWDPDGDPVLFGQGAGTIDKDGLANWSGITPDICPDGGTFCDDKDQVPQWVCDDGGSWPYQTGFGNNKVVWDVDQGHRIGSGSSLGEQGVNGEDSFRCLVSGQGVTFRPTLYVSDGDPSDEGYSLESCIEYSDSGSPFASTLDNHVCANGNPIHLGGVGNGLTVNNPPSAWIIQQTKGDLFGITPFQVSLSADHYDPDGDPLSNNFNSATGFEWDYHYSRSWYWGGNNDDVLNVNDFNYQDDTVSDFDIDSAGVWNFAVRATTEGTHTALVQSDGSGANCFDEDLGDVYPCDTSMMDLPQVVWDNILGLVGGIASSQDCKWGVQDPLDLLLYGDGGMFLLKDEDAAMYNIGQSVEIFGGPFNQTFLAGSVCDIVDIPSGWNGLDGDLSRVYINWNGFLFQQLPIGETFIRNTDNTLTGTEEIKTFTVTTDGYVGNLQIPTRHAQSGNILSNGASAGANNDTQNDFHAAAFGEWDGWTIIDSEDQRPDSTVMESSDFDDNNQVFGQYSLFFDSSPPNNPQHTVMFNRFVHTSDDAAISGSFGGWFNMNYEDQLVGTSQAGSNISVLDSFGFGLAIDSAACSPSAIEGVCRNVTTLETGLYPSLADVSKTSNPASPDMFVAFSSTNKTLTKKTTDRGRSWENVSAVNNSGTAASPLYLRVSADISDDILAVAWADTSVNSTERVTLGCTDNMNPTWQLNDYSIGDPIQSPNVQHSPAIEIFGDIIFTLWSDNRRGGQSSEEVFFRIFDGTDSINNPTSCYQ